LFGSGGVGGLGGYTNTPEGKVLAGAFADAYNRLVGAVRNYKAQEVKGGLGTGGTLRVQGGATPASQALESPAPAPATKPAAKPAPKTTTQTAPKKLLRLDCGLMKRSPARELCQPGFVRFHPWQPSSCAIRRACARSS